MSLELDSRVAATLVLSRRQVAELLDLGECIAAVESALRAQAEGRTIPSQVIGAHVAEGGFHIKSAGLAGPRPFFATKINGNFHANTERFGLPRIQGLILLSDARNGYPLAVMDSVEITAQRTAAATAVAAEYLAPRDARVATICGCGVQGRAQLAALRLVRPIESVFAVDTDSAVAERFAADFVELEVEPVTDLALAARRSEIIVTCTPSRHPILGPDDVPRGAFVAAVGADSEEKQELEPRLMVGAAVVVDHLEQCATIGELHHALERGLLSRADVHCELAELVAGRCPETPASDVIKIFDSTGIALEDVAAAALVYERARQMGIGTPIEIL